MLPVNASHRLPLLQVADDAEYKLKHCFVQTVQLISALVDSSELRACVPGRARLSVVLMSFFGSDKAVRAAIDGFDSRMQAHGICTSKASTDLGARA